MIHKKWKTIYKQKNIRALLIMLRKFYFYTFSPSGSFFGHLLRGENLEAGFAKKGFSTSATRRQSEAVYE